MMVVVHVDQVEGWWSPPPHQRELKVLLSPAKQDVADMLSMGMVILPPGESGDPHTHGEAQETWYVISGRGKLKIGEETAELIPDTVVVAPKGIEHQILNDGDEPLKALFLFSPAGPEKKYLSK
jgi:mannose-6-phosphate isomerase-like protein (cupin superfamily)